jgi:L-asparagine transporter-like permease
VLFTLAARGDAPQAMVVLNKRKVPARAILLGSSFGFVAVILSIVSPDRVFQFLLNTSGALMVVVYLLACFAHYRLRRQMEQSSPDKLIIRVWLFPWLTYATIAAMFAVLIAMAVTEAHAAEFRASAIVVAIVFLIYAAVRRRRRVSSGAAQTV